MFGDEPLTWQEAAKSNRELIERYARQTRIILALLFVCMLPLGVVSVVLIKQEARQRANAIRTSCHEANDRHATAKIGLEALAAKTPAQPGQSEKQREVVVDEFVNALAPMYNCDKRVKELTK